MRTTQGHPWVRSSGGRADSRHGWSCAGEHPAPAPATLLDDVADELLAAVTAEVAEPAPWWDTEGKRRSPKPTRSRRTAPTTRPNGWHGTSGSRLSRGWAEPRSTSSCTSSGPRCTRSSTSASGCCTPASPSTGPHGSLPCEPRKVGVLARAARRRGEPREPDGAERGASRDARRGRGARARRSTARRAAPGHRRVTVAALGRRLRSGRAVARASPRLAGVLAFEVVDEPPQRRDGQGVSVVARVLVRLRVAPLTETPKLVDHRQKTLCLAHGPSVSGVMATTGAAFADGPPRP